MAFSRKKIEERKTWLRGFVPGTYLDHTAVDISYTDFVNKVTLCSAQILLFAAECCVQHPNRVFAMFVVCQ